MLSEHEAIATVAVKDLKTAADFYDGKLGLKAVSREGEEVIGYRCGNSVLNVYRSEYAGTNKANAETWAVGDDVAGVLLALKAKGVVVEHCDFPVMTLQGDVHLSGDINVAWFKDPDGNILNLVSR